MFNGFKIMGFFGGAYKRLKNSWGNIGKNVGNAITLAGKSKILGFLAPTGLGSFVNTALEKLGQSTYKTGQALLGEISGQEYIDSLSDINKYGAVFGPYNTYKTIRDYGVKDGVRRVFNDNVDYVKQFLPMGGEPEKHINNALNTVKDYAVNDYNEAKNIYNEIKDQGVVNYTKNKIDDVVDQTNNFVNQKINDVNSFINDGPIDYYREKASEKAKQIAQTLTKGKSKAGNAMSKVYDYINNINN